MSGKPKRGAKLTRENAETVLRRESVKTSVADEAFEADGFWEFETALQDVPKLRAAREAAPKPNQNRKTGRKLNQKQSAKPDSMQKFDSWSVSDLASERPRTGRKSKARKSKHQKPIKIEDAFVELKAQGISMASALGRPVLILKDEDTGEVLPIWMQPIDATLAVAELSHSTSATPHSPTRALLHQLQVRVYSCVFKDLVGHHQFADLVFHDASNLDRPDRRGSLRVRADEAMSLCLQIGTRFFARRSFMEKSRDLDIDLAKLEYNLGEGLLPELKEELENSSKKHPYVM